MTLLRWLAVLVVAGVLLYGVTGDTQRREKRRARRCAGCCGCQE